MHSVSGNWKLGLTYSIITVIMWALLPIAIKGIMDRVDSITITWYRMAIAAAITALPFFKRGLWPWKKLNQPRLAIIMMIGIIGLLLNYWFYLIGLETTTPEATQTVIQFAPLLLLIASVIWFKEDFSVKQALGVITFVGGMVLFFNLRLEQFIHQLDGYVIGLIWVFISAIAWAAYGMTQKYLLQAFTAQEVLLVIYIAGAIAFLPWAEPSQALSLDTVGWWLLLFGGLNTVIAYGAFAEALVHWEASRVSAAITTVPLVTLAFMALVEVWQPGYIEAEPLNAISWIGAFLVVVGSMITALSKRKPA